MHAGMRIIEAPVIPRYQLPAELIPGVPWDPAFRAEINAWAKDFLGGGCLVPDDQAYIIGRDTVMVSPRTYALLKGLRL